MEQTALRGTFNEDPANYDRYRPRYMPELFETIFAYGEKAGCSRGKALEMGSGTGQATEPFLRAGWQVTAVEMGDNLASFAREKFRDQPGLKVVCGDFLTAPLEGPYDLFYAATSFHWVGTKEAFPRIQSLLKPGGVVALFWNHPCPPGNRGPRSMTPSSRCMENTGENGSRPTWGFPRRTRLPRFGAWRFGDSPRWKPGCFTV